MSDPVSAVIIVAAAVTEVAAGGYSAYREIKSANQEKNIELDEVRQQQLQLRLQQNEDSIIRTNQLRETLATQEVQYGVSGVAPTGGNAHAIIEKQLSDFVDDEDMQNLNFASKQMTLSSKERQVQLKVQAAKVQAVTGFVKTAASATMLAASGSPSGAVAGKAGSSAATVQGTYGFQNYFNSHFDNLNLNR